MNTDIPMFPLGTSYLPGDIVVLNVFEPRYRALVQHVMETDKLFGTVLIEQGSEVGGNDRRFSHGVLVLLQTAVEVDGIIRVAGTATNIISVDQWLDDDPYPRAEFSIQLADELEATQCHSVASTLSLTAQQLRSLFEKYRAMNSPVNLDARRLSILGSLAGGRWWDDNVSTAELWRSFWFLASLVPCGVIDRYELLADGPLTDRLIRLRRTIEHVDEMLEFRLQ